MEKLHLENAFEDGPQTRNLLRLFETDSLMLRNYAASLHKCFGRIVAAQKELSAATQALSNNLKAYEQEHFPLESNESILSSTLGQFAVFVDELSSVQQVLYTQFKDSAVFPINKFLQADLDEILTLKEVFQSACDEHERSLAAYMKYPKKKEQEKGRQEAVDDLYVARRKFHQTALHYYSALNSLQYKRKSSLLEPLIGLMNAQKSFFEIGKEALSRKDIDEFVGNITASVLGVQEELREASQKMCQEIETIEKENVHKYYAEPLPGIPQSLPNCMMSQKAGHLFLRIKLSLLSSRWDRCYFFIQGGNLMCQTKDEVAGSTILDLNEAVKIEAVDVDDRRFVFQIIQLSTKKTVLLQAESAFERDEWMSTIANASVVTYEQLTADCRTTGSLPVLIDAASSETAARSSFSDVRSSLTGAIPEVINVIRSGDQFSSPSSGGIVYPVAPIQFDIMPLTDNVKLTDDVNISSNSLPGGNFQSKSTVDEVNQKTFAVRFLGSQQVITDRGEPIVLETVRQVMAARAMHNIFRMTEFYLAISSSSLRLLDTVSGGVSAGFALQDVSYWAVHNDNKRLFGFITRLHDLKISDRSTFACYVFECNTSGEEICHAIVEATQAGYKLFMQNEAENTEKEKELLLANIQQLENLPEHPKVSADSQVSPLGQQPSAFVSTTLQSSSESTRQQQREEEN